MQPLPGIRPPSAHRPWRLAGHPAGRDWTDAIAAQYYHSKVDEPADPESRVSALPSLILQAHLVPRISPLREAGVAVSDASFPNAFINGVPVVATPAEIDITTADQLRAALLYAATGGHPVVVVDMTGTRFCDSAGLHALTAAYERMHGKGSELRVVVPAGGTVARVFALTGIDRFVPCFPHLEEALPSRPAGQPCSRWHLPRWRQAAMRG